MIRIQSLEFSYGKKQVLNGLHLEIPEGMIFGLLGPNGSGKTTLFRILSTMLAPQKGDVTWLGYDLGREAAKVRATLGVVFQYPSLDPQLTVEENMQCQGALYGLCGNELKGRIEDRLKKLGVWDRRGAKARELSGGLKRRVELAKALLHEPQVLLLDEPSTGLDPRARAELWDLLVDLNREKKMTMIVTTHLMEEAEKCSRLVIMDQGRVIAEGTPAQLKGGLGTGSVWIETENVSELDSAIQAKFQVKTTRVPKGLKMDHAAPQRLIADLIEAFPGKMDSVAFHKPSLEDVFLQKTGRTFEAGEVVTHVKK